MLYWRAAKGNFGLHGALGFRGSCGVLLLCATAWYYQSEVLCDSAVSGLCGVHCVGHAKYLPYSGLLYVVSWSLSYSYKMTLRYR